MNIPDYIPVLSHGGHSDPKQGACVMEMVSFIAGEAWSDRPDCVLYPIQNIAQRVNDFVSDDNRSIIADMIPRFIGTDKIIGIMEDRKFLMACGVKLEAHPELSKFTPKGRKNTPESVLSEIKSHFQNERDMDKRFTNEEYDKFAMTILDVVLDAADEILERGNYEVTKEEAFAKVAELDNQKAYVRKASNV